MQNLSCIAIHLIDNPRFMAYELAQLAVTGVNLADELGTTTPDQINNLAVCGVPRDDNHWAEDVSAIADQVGIDPVKLGALLGRPGPRRQRVTTVVRHHI